MTAIPLQPCHGSPGTLRRQAVLVALGEAAHRAVAMLGEWHRRIRERDQLARLDDRMLRDIGLTRCDAEVLINKPFWRG